ncbi:MAG: ATP-binding cassette domain-containing protein [Snowella sp.]|nr:ATP-binding cassette domain-containing protein [Snowella sp.]
MKVSNTPYLILTNQGQTLPPFQLTKSKHILGRDPQIADLLVPDDWGIISRCQATLIEHQGTYIIYDGDRHQPSSNRLFINNHLISYDSGYPLQNGDVIKIGQNINILITLQFHNSNSLPTAKTSSFDTVYLKEKSIVLGRDPDANLQLDSPTVSRKHAVIDYLEPQTYILYDYSTNGIYVNGIKVNSKILINTTAIIKILPYTLILQNDQLIIADRGENIRLDANSIVRTVKGKNQETIVLLNQISLPIEPGQLVALVGGSGAGKSTFMKTLLGIEPTTRGTVYLNGEDLRNNFNLYRNQIGYVPQKDIIHKELKVEEALRYAARLRLPKDADIDQIVEKTLTQIEMQERRSVLVKDLSGGQLKRVSIGVELLVDPKLFFLDEPTSGLDPGLDKKMMQLLRKLADQGRTIVLVTHATGNINLCDRLAFLGQGGNLCFYGPFTDACQFFGLANGDFADAYIQLDSKQAVANTAQRYQRSSFQRQYVDQRLGVNTVTDINPKPPKAKASIFRQAWVLAQRYFQIMRRDRLNLGISIATAPIGILLINLAIAADEPFILGTDPDPKLAPLAQTVLLVFTSAAIWVGLASSLQEIVKENDIYSRERLVNLNIFAYLISKISILSGLALLQTAAMAIVILASFRSPLSPPLPWFLGLMITSYLTLFAAICLGLMVSTISKSSTQANTALPILLLPQIIFSGVLFKIQGISQYFSWLMISRWSVGAYGSLVNINYLIPEAQALPDGTLLELSFKPSPVYDPSWSNLALNWQVLIVQSLVYLGIIFIVKKQKDVL